MRTMSLMMSTNTQAETTDGDERRASRYKHTASPYMLLLALLTRTASACVLAASACVLAVSSSCIYIVLSHLLEDHGTLSMPRQLGMHLVRLYVLCHTLSTAASPDLSFSREQRD